MTRHRSPLKRVRRAAQAVMLAALLAALAGRDLHHVIYPAAVIVMVAAGLVATALTRPADRRKS